MERAAEINARIHGPAHARTLVILNNRAGLARDRGDYARAELLYRDILRLRREFYPTDSIQQAYSMHGLGWSLTELGRPQEAEPFLREVVRLTDHGPEPSTTVHQMARSTLGRCLSAQRRYAEAEPLLRESYEWTAARAPNSGFIPIMLQRLTDLYEAWGRPALADRYRSPS
jgi:tetratricopeptide (TPR) repeat protein